MNSYKYCDMPYPRVVLDHLHNMQKSKIMCDMKLIVEDEEIWVHKFVLSAVSPYFRTLSNTDFRENVENEITFSDTSKLTLQTIITYVYTGEIEINESNVYEIMAAANRFQISLLKLPVSDFLTEIMHGSNCLQILAHTQLYDYDEVFAKTLKYIAVNFHFVVTKDIFYSAPADIVRVALCQRGLPSKSILSSLGSWLKHNDCVSDHFKDFYFANIITLEHLDRVFNLIIEKNPQFAGLLTAVYDFIIENYSNKDTKSIDKHIKEHQLILAIGGASQGTIHPTVESYTSCWSFSLPSSSMNTIAVIPPMRSPRMCHAVAQPCHRSDVVYVLGGLGTACMGKALNSCEKYDVRTNEWTPLKEMPTKVKGHAAVWLEGKVMVVGGMSEDGKVLSDVWSNTSCWTFSLPSSSMNTIAVIPSMRSPRMCHAVAQPCHRSDVVYVLGGLGTACMGKALNSCEKYDVRTNEWTPLKEMPTKVKGHAAVWLEGKVMVVGGMSEDGKALSDVWEYLEKDNCWRSSTPLQTPRSGHSAVNVLGTLYVLGGQGNHAGSCLSSVERYNADLRTWSRVTDMPECKYEFGCVAFAHYIYVIGGATRNFVMNSVYKYNTLRDEWTECTDIPVPKSGFGCTVREGRIYCVGGSDIVHGPLSSVEIYNPETNRWHYLSHKLQTPRSYTCAATLRVCVEETDQSH